MSRLSSRRNHSGQSDPDLSQGQTSPDGIDRRGLLKCMAWAGSTAFLQPAPGSAPSPGPMKVPAEKLRDVLGITEVNFVAQNHHLATIDASLSGASGEGHESPSI